MIYCCKEAQKHNLFFVENGDSFDAYSKYYNMWDKSEDQPPNEDWYLKLQLRDIKYCPYCGKYINRK